MNTVTAAALDAARARFLVGWPLLVLALALYSPIGGATRLLLLGAGLFYLGRQPHLATGPKKHPASTTRSPKKSTSTTGPRQRGGDGRWSK